MNDQDRMTVQQRVQAVFVMYRQIQDSFNESSALITPELNLSSERERNRRRKRIRCTQALIAALTAYARHISLQRCTRVRKIWMLQRSTHWWKEIVMRRRTGAMAILCQK